MKYRLPAGISRKASRARAHLPSNVTSQNDGKCAVYFSNFHALDGLVKVQTMSKATEEAVSQKMVCEGKAKITFFGGNDVFYNPVQVFNRDLSVACIQSYVRELFPKTVTYKKKSKRKNDVMVCGEPSEETSNIAQSSDRGSSDDPALGIVLFEGLSASGLRSIRYALEVAGIERIIANDISADAVELMKKNIEDNGVSSLVEPSQNDASLVMYMHRHPQHSRFDVIDLDPYGSPAEFLDGAVQAVSDGGMLAVTCTDMAVLCGNHSEACYAKYGSMPLKGKFCHEMALRILLSCIESHANHYKRYIVPLVSVSADFYIRVFVQVFTSAAEVKRSASKKSLVYCCVGCGSFYFQQVGKRMEQGKSKKYPPGTGPPVGEQCPQCSGKFQLGGPVWSEPIHDTVFVQQVLEQVKQNADSYKTSDRLTGVLTVILEELSDTPLYHTLDQLCSVLHCTTPSMIQLRSALLRLGYQVSSSHASKTAVKTDAPIHVMWDVLKAWVENNPLKKQHASTCPGEKILSKPREVQDVSFNFTPGANPPSRQLKLTRFPENPEAEWGPKARARKNPTSTSGELSERRKQNQGKRKAGKDVVQKSLKSYECKRFKLGLCDFDDETCKYTHVTSCNNPDNNSS